MTYKHSTVGGLFHSYHCLYTYSVVKAGASSKNPFGSLTRSLLCKSLHKSCTSYETRIRKKSRSGTLYGIGKLAILEQLERLHRISY